MAKNVQLFYLLCQTNDERDDVDDRTFNNQDS